MKNFELRILTLAFSPVSRAISFRSESLKDAFTDAISILKADGILSQFVDGLYGVSLYDCQNSCFSFKLCINEFTGRFEWCYSTFVHAVKGGDEK